MLESIRGKKTYIAAGLAVITAIAGWLMGEIELGNMVNQVVAAILAAALRNGMPKA